MNSMLATQRTLKDRDADQHAALPRLREGEDGHGRLQRRLNLTSTTTTSGLHNHAEQHAVRLLQMPDGGEQGGQRPPVAMAATVKTMNGGHWRAWQRGIGRERWRVRRLSVLSFSEIVFVSARPLCL